MRNYPILFLAATLLLRLLAPARALADTLEMKNGTIVSGQYVGGSATTVRFETAQGVQVTPTSDILAITFSGGAASAPTAAAAHPAPVAAAAATPGAPAAPSTVAIPAGTPLVVRMMDGISSQNKAGTKFTTTLDSDLFLNGAVALKAGTKIYGELSSSRQAGRAVGKSEIDIRLTEIASPGGSVLVATSNFKEAGKGSGGKTVGAAAVGAGVGAIVGGGKGAGKGAAIAGGASLLKKGETVTVPPNMLLEFQLTREVTVTAP
jgi:hypothetical protein